MNTSLLLSGTIALIRTAGPRLTARLVAAAWRDAAVRACRFIGRWLGCPAACACIDGGTLTP